MIDYTTSTGPTTINIKPDNSVEIINANGDSIVMLNDGNITLTHSANVNINCTNANINASGETHINSPRIKLGESAAESIIKGDTFAGIFDAHTHIGNIGLPTSPPTSVTAPALSTKNTTD